MIERTPGSCVFVAVITLMTFCDDVFLDEPGSCLSARFNYYIPRRQTTPPPPPFPHNPHPPLGAEMLRRTRDADGKELQRLQLSGGTSVID